MGPLTEHEIVVGMLHRQGYSITDTPLVVYVNKRVADSGHVEYVDVQLHFDEDGRFRHMENGRSLAGGWGQ